MLIYRNLRWNVPIACYMALRGVSVIWLIPIFAVEATVVDESLGIWLMLTIVALSGGVPFARALAGRVWLEEAHLCSRNPFRTVRYPISNVGGITTQALWQNFFVVAAIEPRSGLRDRSQRLVPVPASDAAILAARLNACTAIDAEARPPE